MNVARCAHMRAPVGVVIHAQSMPPAMKQRGTGWPTAQLYRRTRAAEGGGRQGHSFERPGLHGEEVCTHCCTEMLGGAEQLGVCRASLCSGPEATVDCRAVAERGRQCVTGTQAQPMSHRPAV